jgi:hypothetical protein
MFRRNLVCFGNELKQDHDLAKVGVEGSNPFARSKNFNVQPCEQLAGLLA